jgi:hypothetical protein
MRSLTGRILPVRATRWTASFRGLRRGRRKYRLSGQITRQECRGGSKIPATQGEQEGPTEARAIRPTESGGGTTDRDARPGWPPCGDGAEEPEPALPPFWGPKPVSRVRVCRFRSGGQIRSLPAGTWATGSADAAMSLPAVMKPARACEPAPGRARTTNTASAIAECGANGLTPDLFVHSSRDEPTPPAHDPLVKTSRWCGRGGIGRYFHRQS